MRALNDTVIVEHLDDIPESSILEIPSSVNKPATRTVSAKVIDVAPKSSWFSEIAKGDTVLVPHHLGTRLPVEQSNGKQWIVYDDEDILAKVEN